MANRTISVRLKAEVNQFKADMATAAKASAAAAKETEAAWDQSSSHMGKMMQAAKQNESAWNTAGGVLTAVGGGMVALGVGATKAGIEFNSLKQTAGAALTSVLGSAEGAARQMEKMNEFGRGTWVMRDSLIRAQQTMTGFGIETQKVIPYMEALAETVAATGGSNQDFEELARVMGKVESSGKITAETFNEFGTRGVDAAALIGEQMGMTAAEIRESVTKGTLDAGEALDALAEGMQSRFEGSTENLRNTFRGAFDNVAGAWRDLSASLAEPLVGESGGGLAVGGLNALADSLNALRDVSEEIPGPVKIAVGALAGIGAAGSLAAGGFLLLAPRILETQQAFQILAGQDDLVGKTARNMQKMGPAVRGVAKAAGIATAALVGLQIVGAIFPREDIARADDYARALQRVKGGGDELLAALEDVGKWSAANDFLGAEGVNDFSDALDRVANPTRMDKINQSLEWISPWGSSFGELEDKVSEVDAALAQLVDGGNAALAAEVFAEIQAANPDLTFEQLAEIMPTYIAAAEDAGVAAETAAGGVVTLSAAAVEAQDYLSEVSDGLIESGNGFLDFAEKATDAEVSLRDWIKVMEDQIDAQQNWFGNLETLIGRGAPQEFIDFLMSLGEEGAFRVKQLADASDSELQRAVDAFTDGSAAATIFADDVAGIPDVNLEADSSVLREQVWFAEQKLRELGEMEPSPVVDAQITALEEKIGLAKEQLGDLDSDEAMPLVGVSGADTTKGEIKDVHQALLDIPDDATSTVGVTGYEDAMGKITNLGDALSELDKGSNVGMGERIRRLWDRRLGADEAYKRAADRKKATGGAIHGPGTGTSDDILAWLSNGEHVLTAEEVRRMGGHSEVYRWRNAVMAGEHPAFASGGAVSSAKDRLSQAERELERIQNRGKPKPSKSDREREAAQKRVERAREALRKAEERQRDAERKAEERKREQERRRQEEQARRERVAGLRTDLRTDVRRGSIRDQVTGSLSGGYSAVDRLFGLGKNEDLSKSARNVATTRARKFESDLKRLYGQAERLDEKLKNAQDKASELEGIQKSVASGLLSGRDLDMGDYMNFSGGQWTTHTGVAGATRRMTADVGRMKEFANKLQKLMKAGIPGAILQEIAGAGVDEGIALADAFLNASSSEQQSYIGTWNEYEKQANRIGNIVTGGFYDGGVDAAKGVVNGLESQQKSIENQIARLAKSMEDTLKSVLGIRSPSRVMAELGAYTAEGLVQGLLSGQSDVAGAASTLAAAAVPAIALDVKASPVLDSDALAATSAMQDMSAVTLQAMQMMRADVSAGWDSMLADTQSKQFSMRDITAAQQESMRAVILGKQTEAKDSLAQMQESMRSTVADRQLRMRDNVASQQESMRSVMADKQGQMRDKNRTEFESMRATTGEKLTSMRSSADSTMTGFKGDYDGHMGSMKRINRDGHTSMEDASEAAFKGIRSGMNAQMREAKPELGGKMNNLIGVLAKFTSSVNKAFGDVGVDLSSPQKLAFAAGGVMPGYTPGRDVHSFYSPTAGSLYLSGGEAIMRPEFTRAVGGERGVKELNDAARRGDHEHLNLAMHFANGGVMPSSAPVRGVNAFADSGVWRGLWSIVRGAFPHARKTSDYRGGSRTASGNQSYHSRGMAVDLAGRYQMDTSTMGQIAEWLVGNYGGSNEIIYSPLNGRQVKDGRNYMYRGAVRGMHFNHVHWANRTVPGGATGGPAGAWDGDVWIPHPFLDKAGVSADGDLKAAYERAAKKQIKDIIGKHSGQLSGGDFSRQLGAGIMRATRDGLIKKATDYGELMGDGGIPGAANGPVKQMAREVLEKMGWGDQWADLDWLVTRESGWNPNAQNPTSTAYGLFQFLNGTWGSVGAKKTSDPLKQIQAGLKYIQQRYGDVRGARSFWERNNWYADGTKNAKSGWAVVGEEGPELINLGGGERIESNPQTRKALAANRTFLPSQSSGVDAGQIAKIVASELAKRPQNVVNVDSTSHTETGIARKVSNRLAEDTSLYLTGV